jgi:hypothetical protein
MHTITAVSESKTGGTLEPCLQCKKNVATTTALGTLEVCDDTGVLLGYLHPLCKTSWEDAQRETKEEAEEKTAESPKPPPQSVEPRQERLFRFEVVVRHKKRGLVRIDTDVADGSNALRQAKMRNQDPDYEWESAEVEKFPLH